MFRWVERIGLSVVEKLAVQENIDLSSPLVTFLDRFGEYVAREYRAIQLQQRCMRALYNELEQSHASVIREVTALRGAIVSSLPTKATSKNTGTLTPATATATFTTSPSVSNMRVKVDRHPETYLPVVRVSLNFVPDLVVYVPRRYAKILNSNRDMQFNNHDNSFKSNNHTTTVYDSESRIGGEGITFGLHVRREIPHTAATTMTTTNYDRKKQLTESVSHTQTQGQTDKHVTPLEQQTTGNGNAWHSPPRRRTYRRSPRLSGKLAKAAEHLKSKCKAAAWQVSVTDLVKCWVDSIAAIPQAELQRLGTTWSCEGCHKNSIGNDSTNNANLDSNGYTNGQEERGGTNANSTEQNRGTKRPASEMSSPAHRTRQKGRWKARRLSGSSLPFRAVTSPSTAVVRTNGCDDHQHDRNNNNNSNPNSNDDRNNNCNHNSSNNNINPNSNSNNNYNNDKKMATHSQQRASTIGNGKPASSSTNQNNAAGSPQQIQQNGTISNAGLNSSPSNAANAVIYGPTAAKPPTGRPRHRWGSKMKVRKQEQEQEQQRQKQDLSSGIMVGCNTMGNTSGNTSGNVPANTAIRSTGSFAT